MRTLVSWLISLVLVGTCYVPEHVSANRIVFNPQQKSQLQQVKTIFIKALALTEKGLVEPTLIEKAVSDRLTSTGFTVMATESEPHDVMLKVKCDERKPWGGVRKSDGEIQQPGAPSRNWKGPACQLSYALDAGEGALAVRGTHHVRQCMGGGPSRRAPRFGPIRVAAPRSGIAGKRLPA